LHLQTKTNKSHLKQVGKNFMLVTEHVPQMKQLQTILDKMLATVNEVKASPQD